MLRFDPESHYFYTREPKNSKNSSKNPEEDVFVRFDASPTQLLAAKQLITDYYKDKYDTVIIINAEADYYEQKLVAVLPELRKKTGDYRAAFSFGTSHSVTVIYFKENDQEGLLYSDSLASGTYKIAAKKLHQDTGLPVYLVMTGRQADYVSCHLDSLIQCRIATAKDKRTGQYLVPDFLTKMISRSAPKEEKIALEETLPIMSLDESDTTPSELLLETKTSSKVSPSAEFYIEAKLPDECLITAQLSLFRNLHKEEKERIIHVRKEGETETLAQKETRYNILLQNGKIINGYNRKKSLKFAHIIEIQFYINQLQNLLGPSWTSKIREQFIYHAKQKLKEGSFEAKTELFDFANTFLFRIKPSCIRGPFFKLRATNRTKRAIAASSATPLS